MSRRRRLARREIERGGAPATEMPQPPRQAPPPWWQGVWPALGGFFNLLTKWR